MRIERVGTPVVVQGFFEPPQSVKGHGAHVQRIGVVRPQPLTNVETGERFFEAPLQLQQHTSLICRIQVCRINCKRALKARDRVRRAVVLDAGIAETVPERSVIRLELHRLVEHPQRIVAPIEIEQRRAEQGQIGRPRFPSDRARDPFDRVVELSGVETDERHQMQQLEMLRVSFERPPAAELGVEKPPRTQVA